MSRRSTADWRVVSKLVITLGASSLLSMLLLAARVVYSDTGRYVFMIWNLFLAWIPFALALLIMYASERKMAPWVRTLGFCVWLGFLPNAFYILSDFIHLHPTGEVSMLSDVVLMASFVWNGFLLGFISVYLMQLELMKYFSRRSAHAVVATIFLACSFAIYLGRYLRWNTWDVVANPADVLIDVSDRIINPAAHLQTVSTTVLFFALLSTIYFVVWQLIELLRTSKR